MNIFRTASASYTFDKLNGDLIEIEGCGAESFAVSKTGNWELLLHTGKRIGPADAGKFEIIKNSKGGRIFSWQGFAGLISGNAKVRIFWSANDGLLTGVLSYCGFVREEKVERINFPVVKFKPEGVCSLIMPKGLGLIIRDAGKRIFSNPALENKISWGYNKKSPSMQFSACMTAKSGLYFDTRDSLACIKQTEYSKTGRDGFIKYTGGHLVPQDGTSPRTYQLPYKAGILPFRGGWFEAASIYKKWARKQKWYTNKKNARRKKEIDNICLWAWNRGAIGNVMPPLEKLKERLKLPVALDWYWWHKKPYDTGYPDYLPPREGVEKFRRAVSRLNANGIFSQVYINGVCWDMDEAHWAEGGEKSAVINKDGAVKNGIYNKFMPHRLAYVCGESKEFGRKILKTAGEIKRIGFPGLYLDVIGNHYNDPCYNPHHKHPKGGGNYSVKGFRKLLRQIKKECPGLALSTESCAEVYMDLFDTGIVLDPSWERVGSFPGFESIPLFRAVYGDALTLFGNYALIDGVPPYDELWPETGKWKNEKNWNMLCPDQFFFEIARSLVFGLQPTVCNLKKCHLHDKKFSREIDFLCEAARFYHENRGFLLRGELHNPGKMETGKKDVSFLTRMIFTPEGAETVRKKEFSAILHSVWKDNEGRKALITANFTGKIQRFNWTNGEYSCSGHVPPRSFRKIILNRRRSDIT